MAGTPGFSNTATDLWDSHNHSGPHHRCSVAEPRRRAPAGPPRPRPLSSPAPTSTKSTWDGAQERAERRRCRQRWRGGRWEGRRAHAPHDSLAEVNRKQLRADCCYKYDASATDEERRAGERAGGRESKEHVGGFVGLFVYLFIYFSLWPPDGSLTAAAASSSRSWEEGKKKSREVMKDVPESGRRSLNPFCKARLIGLHLKLKLAV